MFVGGLIQVSSISCVNLKDMTFGLFHTSLLSNVRTASYNLTEIRNKTGVAEVRIAPYWTVG